MNTVKILTVLCAVLVVTPTFPCELYYFPGISIAENRLVFSGTIIAPAEFGAAGDSSELHGFVCKVDEAVILPDGIETVEVYPAGIDLGCERYVQTKEVVLEKYPIGSRVRVVGERLSRSGVLKVEVFEPTGGVIQRADSPEGVTASWYSPPDPPIVDDYRYFEILAELETEPPQSRVVELVREAQAYHRFQDWTPAIRNRWYGELVTKHVRERKARKTLKRGFSHGT